MGCDLARASPRQDYLQYVHKCKVKKSQKCMYSYRKAKDDTRTHSSQGKYKGGDHGVRSVTDKKGSIFWEEIGKRKECTKGIRSLLNLRERVVFGRCVSLLTDSFQATCVVDLLLFVARVV